MHSILLSGELTDNFFSTHDILTDWLIDENYFQLIKELKNNTILNSCLFKMNKEDIKLLINLSDQGCPWRVDTTLSTKIFLKPLHTHTHTYTNSITPTLQIPTFLHWKSPSITIHIKISQTGQLLSIPLVILVVSGYWTLDTPNSMPHNFLVLHPPH